MSTFESPEAETAMVATEGHRLALVTEKYDFPGITGTYKALIPRKAMTGDPEAKAAFSERVPPKEHPTLYSSLASSGSSR